MESQFNDYKLGYLNETSYRSTIQEAARFFPLLQLLEIDLSAEFDPEFVQAVKSTLAE